MDNWRALVRRRFLAVAVTAVTVAAGVGVAAAPAAAAAAITDTIGQAYTSDEAALARVGRKYGLGTFYVCDYKADGHHARGTVNWIDFTNGDTGYLYIKNTQGFGKCLSLSMGVLGCDVQMKFNAEVWEGSTRLYGVSETDYYNGC